MKIKVNRSLGDYQASVEGIPNLSATAKSAEEAIGTLILKNASEFGLTFDLTGSSPMENRRGLSREHYAQRPKSASDFVRERDSSPEEAIAT